MTNSVEKPLIPHPRFLAAVADTKTRLLRAPPGSIIRMFAPTGAGKTEICFAVARAIAGPPDTWASGSLPVSIVRAGKDDRGRFAPKSFAKRSLAAVHHPDLRWAYRNDVAGFELAFQDYAKQIQRTDFWKGLVSRSTEEDFRTGTEISWAERSVRYAIVDDAHAMTAVKRGIHPSDHILPWVAAAEASRTTMLFVGTSAMHSLWDGEGEVQRRAKSIYVGRYDFDVKADQLAFAKLLKSLTATPLWANLKILPHARSIYLVTYGVFGQVKALLERAEDHAIARGAQHVSESDLYKARPNANELRRMAERSAEFDALSTPATDHVAQEIYAIAFFQAPNAAVGAMR